MKHYNLFAITLMLSSTSLYAADSVQFNDQPPAIAKPSEQPNHKAELQQPMPVPGYTLIFKKDSNGTGVFFGTQQIAHTPYSLEDLRSLNITPDGTMYLIESFGKDLISLIKDGKVTTLLSGQYLICSTLDASGTMYAAIYREGKRGLVQDFWLIKNGVKTNLSEFLEENNIYPKYKIKSLDLDMDGSLYITTTDYDSF